MNVTKATRPTEIYLSIHSIFTGYSISVQCVYHCNTSTLFKMHINDSYICKKI